MEALISSKDEYLVSEKIIPTRRHQAEEELLQFERDLAGAIYFQRDREGRLY